MFRFFSALCILSIVAFLGLQRGQAGPLPERPPWQSDVDDLDPGKLDAGAARADRVSAIPPPANWAPPAEIAAEAATVRGPSALDDGALVWRLPAEIASIQSVAVGHVHRVKWALPAEITPEAPAVEHRSAVGDGALAWRLPAEIASLESVVAVVGMAVDRAGRASAIHYPAKWALPAEIAPEAPVVEHPSSIGDGAPIWHPPAEIASTQSLVDSSDMAASPSAPIPPSVHWALPAEIAALVSATTSKSEARALVWRPPVEIDSASSTSGRRADRTPHRV